MITLLCFLACSSSDDSVAATTSDGGSTLSDGGTTAGDAGASTDGGASADGGGADLHGQPPKTPVPAPEFVAINRDGSSRSRENLLGQPTVLWFYPAAGTGGCTQEGCGYRDLQPQFDKLGVRIVGASFDPPEENQAWAVEQGYQYELWTDQDKTLALHYGAASSAGAVVPTRITRLLGEDGAVLLEYAVSNTGAHPAEVLEDCQALFGD